MASPMLSSSAPKVCVTPTSPSRSTRNPRFLAQFANAPKSKRESFGSRRHRYTLDQLVTSKSSSNKPRNKPDLKVKPNVTMDGYIDELVEKTIQWVLPTENFNEWTRQQQKLYSKLYMRPVNQSKQTSDTTDLTTSSQSL